MTPFNIASSTVPQTGFDKPTGLPSKGVFFDRLQQALLLAERDGKNAAVLFARIDHLKLINDTFGKQTGDQVLAEISARFRGVMRQSDTLGRPGRDEFMVLLPEIARPEDAAVVANKLLASLRTPFMVGDRALFINANIGISLFPLDAADAEELLKLAYTALIGSIEDGKNSCKIYSPEINERALRRLELETDLRLALDRGEFLLNYQPVFCLKKKSISAMEVLVRWEHPRHGLLGPDHFINVAEQSGIINHIGRWVMDSAFSQNRRWSDLGLAGSRIAVNLSARQFSSRSLVDDIARMLDAHQMDPGLLEIEITESSLMNLLNDTTAKFRRLKDMGVCLSLDDFGTGYSSLSYVKDLPFDRLKIDRSFVQNICSEPRDAAIAAAIVQMAHSLGMQVTGEGVETEEQLHFLRSIDCDEIQGYLLSIPVCCEGMSQLLSAPAAQNWPLNEE